MAWRIEYGLLLLLSTIIDFYCALKIEKYGNNPKLKKRYLSISIFSNLSLLFFFKYFYFFAQNTQSLLANLGIAWNMNDRIFSILLPIGISFYTFQTISYSIDVYRNKLKAETNFVNFALFVSFFPQLVAGPIERAPDLLPQIKALPPVGLLENLGGFKWIIWGFFKKMVIADNIAPFVDRVFDPDLTHSGTTYLLGAYSFALQVYADFSGYSDIAVGIAQLLGITLIFNFRQPYFAYSFQNHWARWHISLSQWLKDYVYIPLGGNRKGKYRAYLNIFLTMLLAGIWHGAGWNFIAWGAAVGIILVIERILQPYISKAISLDNKFFYFCRIFFTFQLICITYIVFRSPSIIFSSYIFQQIFTAIITFTIFDFSTVSNFPKVGVAFAGIMLLWDFYLEFVPIKYKLQLQKINTVFLWKELGLILLIFSILFFGVFQAAQFIYFQF